MAQLIETFLGGVPALVAPAEGEAPLVVLWHGFGSPRSEAEMAAALPLDGLDAHRVYAGLPDFGRRAPADWLTELPRRQRDDYLQQLLGPVVEQAARELPCLVREMTVRYPVNLSLGIGLAGFSAGGIATLLALAEHSVPVNSAVVIGVTRNAALLVDLLERKFDIPYQWSPGALAQARRLDFEERAAEIRASGAELLLVHGDEDDYFPTDDAFDLGGSLEARVEIIEGLKHFLAPGQQPVGDLIEEWFAERL